MREMFFTKKLPLLTLAMLYFSHTNGEEIPSTNNTIEKAPEQKPEEKAPEQKPEEKAPEQKPEEKAPEQKPEEKAPEQKPEGAANTNSKPTPQKAKTDPREIRRYEIASECVVTTLKSNEYVIMQGNSIEEHCKILAQEAESEEDNNRGITKITEYVPPVLKEPKPLKPLKPTTLIQIKEPFKFTLQSITKINIEHLEKTNEGIITGEDQSILISPNSYSSEYGSIVFDKRLNVEERFFPMFKDNVYANAYQVIHTSHYVEGSAVYCPLTHEILFTGPGIQEDGTPSSNFLPRRIYKYSIKTGKTELIWRLQAHEKGHIRTTLSASPDCTVILTNLLLRREADSSTQGILKILQQKGESYAEKELFSTANDGSSIGFSHASLALPKDPRHFEKKNFPWRITAVADFTKKSGFSPILYSFKADSPIGSYERHEIRGLDGVIEFTSTPATGNLNDIATASILRDSGGKLESQVGVFSLDGGGSWKAIVTGSGFMFKSPEFSPYMEEIYFTAESSYTPNLADDIFAIRGGLYKIKGSEELVTVTSLMNLEPFSYLQDKYQPRLMLSSNGEYLWLSYPKINPSIWGERDWSKISKGEGDKLEYPVELMRFTIK